MLLPLPTPLSLLAAPAGMISDPATAANSDAVSQQSASPEGLLSSSEISKEAETLLVGSALNMDFRKLRSVAIEHLLIHAEEAALAVCPVSEDILARWCVRERRHILDSILARDYDEALVSLTKVSPKALDAANSSGVIVAILCAKAREIATRDEEAALKFLSEDAADAAAGVFMDIFPSPAPNNIQNVPGNTDLIKKSGLIKKDPETSSSFPQTASGIGTPSIRSKHQHLTAGHSCEREGDKQVISGACNEHTERKYSRGCGMVGELIEKTLGEILFTKTVDAPEKGPALSQAELETLAMTANAVILESLNLPYISILTNVLDICTGSNKSAISLDLIDSNNIINNNSNTEEMQNSVRSQNHSPTINPIVGSSENDASTVTGQSSKFKSWDLKTLLGIRLIE